MKIVLASRNKHKIGELQTLLGQHIEGVEILSLDDIGFSGDIVEDGLSFAQNALIKATAAASSGYIGLGDDSGLCVRALGGAPGIYSARYSGEHGNDASNNELLIKNLAGESDRYAEFVCVIACVFPDGEKLCVEGRVEGRIMDVVLKDLSPVLQLLITMATFSLLPFVISLFKRRIECIDDVFYLFFIIIDYYCYDVESDVVVVLITIDV